MIRMYWEMIKSNIKAIVAAIVAIGVGVFYYFFKKRGNKIDNLEKEVKQKNIEVEQIKEYTENEIHRVETEKIILDNSNKINNEVRKNIKKITKNVDTKGDNEIYEVEL